MRTWRFELDSPEDARLVSAEELGLFSSLQVLELCTLEREIPLILCKVEAAEAEAEEMVEAEEAGVRKLSFVF